MYNFMRKSVCWLGVAVMCIAVCGCMARGSGCKNIVYEEECEDYTVYTETPFVSGLGDEAFEMSINTSLAEMIGAWNEDFKTRVNINSTEKAEFSVISEVKEKNDKFLSVIIEKSVYTGGAHGNIWRYAQNIDIGQSKVITLDDLFMDAEYVDFLNKRMEELTEENSETYSDLWQKPVITDRQKQDFYIYDGNLIIFYQPYDLSYYAKGFVEFPVSIDSLRGYIKPEYAQILK